MKLRGGYPVLAAWMSAASALCPGPAQAHGLSPGVASFIVSFPPVLLTASLIALYIVLKRWRVAERAAAATAQAGIALVIATVSGIYVWEQASSSLISLLDATGGSYNGRIYSDIVRIYGWFAGLPVIWLLSIFAQCLVLRWRFGVPLSWRTGLLLGVTNIVCVLFAAASAALYASRFI